MGSDGQFSGIIGITQSAGEPSDVEEGGHIMSEIGVRGIDLFSHCRREHLWMDSQLENRRHPAHAAAVL